MMEIQECYSLRERERLVNCHLNQVKFQLINKISEYTDQDTYNQPVLYSMAN